jgi:hypothetical protein
MIKKFLFLIILVQTSISFAQVNNTSPYSYFGIGDTNQQNTVASESMGGVNIANSYLGELNFSNPATLSALQLTTFSIAGGTRFLTIDDGLLNQTNSFTALTSLGFGVPIGKKGGLMVSLQPNSSVGYSIIDEIKEGDEVVESNLFKGNGGTNRFFGSFGYEVYKNLSLGIEGEFIFGNLDNNIYNARKDVAYSTRYHSVSNLEGGSFKIASHYHHQYKEVDISLGLSLKLKNSINAVSEKHLYSYITGKNGEIPIDTIMSNVDLKGKINRPNVLATGVSFGKKNKWNFGLEYETQEAISYDQTVFNNTKIQYVSKSSYRVGGFYIPKNNSITSYWQRVIYRAGLRFENTGIAVRTTVGSGDFTPIDDFGISFGLGLPVGNQLSQINLGFEYGSRGNNNDGLVKENYYNLRLSLNLVDKWFKKNRIN